MQQETKYGFRDRLTKEFPSQIIVDVTEVCNLACIHCPHPEFAKSEHYSKAFLDPLLNEKLVHEVRDHGKGFTQYIRYTSNGEPLAHPRVFEMMTYAKAHSGTAVTLTTNGKILNEKRVERLIETKIDLVDISIDAFTPDTYAKVRVGGNLDETRGNVLRLLKMKNEAKSPLKLVVSYVEQAANTAETKDFETFWKDQGADYVVIRRLHSAAGCNPDVAQQIWDRLSGAERKPCVYPWERIVLGPTGKLAFCPADWTHGSQFKDYRSTTVLAEWQGEFYQKLREAHLTNNYSKHKFCGQCPDWAVTRWPGEGRAYADMVEDFRREGAFVIKPA